MPLITPFFALITLMLVITQDPHLGGITKEFATLGFILSIDNLFAKTYPQSVI